MYTLFHEYISRETNTLTPFQMKPQKISFKTTFPIIDNGFKSNTFPNSSNDNNYMYYKYNNNNKNRFMSEKLDRK